MTQADARCLQIVGLHKRFGALEVLRGVDLAVQAGEKLVDHRTLRLGQNDLAPLHQLAGTSELTARS